MHRQKQDPRNHLMPTISHDYGKIMSYPIMYKLCYDIKLTQKI